MYTPIGDFLFLHFLLKPYFLHFPNRPWMGSFRSPWGFGWKEGTDEIVEQAICKAFEVRLHPFLETLQMAYVLSDFIKQKSNQ